MNGPRRLLVAGVCGATLALAGCGSTTTRSTTHAASPTVPAQTANHYQSQTTNSGRSTGAGAIVLPRMGTIHYACDAAGRLTAVLDTRPAPATESVYVEGVGHHHLRSGTIQPGAPAFAVMAPGSELWHLIQATEPETLEARIAITVGNGCTAQWLARVGVISHAGAWTPPQPWL